MASTKDFWKSEDGVLESSLVMIPLVITFLIAFQLVIAINYRNIEIATLQSGVSSSALSGEVTNQDQIISLTDASGAPLRLLIRNQEKKIPNLLPKFSFLADAANRSTDVTAIAVMEEKP